MTGELGYSLPPAIRRIANNFRIAGWISVWVQTIVGVLSALLFIVNLLEPDNNLSRAGAGLFIGGGLLAVLASAIWGYRYVMLNRQLRKPDPDRRPKPKDARRIVQIGILISLVGIALTLIGGQSTVGLLWLRSLRQISAPGSVLQDASNFINAADIAVVFSVINTFFAHFIGLCTALWLQFAVDRQ